MRYLGIDFGLKKIGLAIGDSETKIASPIEMIENFPPSSRATNRQAEPGPASPGGISCNNQVFDQILDLIEKEGIDEIAIGVPLSVGQFHSSEQLELTRKFISELGDQVKIPIHEIDERFTSTEGQRLRKQEGVVASEDSLAAMLILQAYLDELE